YPPLQGGISAKTYWLYNELSKSDFDFRSVTVGVKKYTAKYRDIERKTTCLRDKVIPWHLPETTLLDDRLLRASLKISDEFRPDIIETNYLWPFFKIGLLIARITGKPLITRHAGSDLIKFYHDSEFVDNLKRYFALSDAVVTNHRVENWISDLCDFRCNKIHVLPSYVPNPDVFKPRLSSKNYDVFFAGKINFYWDLKGMKQLLDFIKRRSLSALFVCGGNYAVEFKRQVEKLEISKLITYKFFVHPRQMPDLIHSCKFVWCWTESGGVEDFSNLIWESIFSGVPCIVNPEIVDKIISELRGIDCSNLLYTVKEGKSGPLFLPLQVKKPGECSGRAMLYRQYIRENQDLYRSLM
ncbi:MAG: glycosyltransferase, partial [Candidatus Wallbacteria bacterium]|nr:glycosyltransferase [Candidatus Wallbacteria bacterium]